MTKRADTTVLSKPARWLFEAFGAISTDSGVTVSRESAARYSPWWAAIAIISGDVARLPLSVYRRDGEDKVKDVGNPLYRLLHDRPNPEMTSFTFRRTLQMQVLTFGNGLAYIDRSTGGIQLWPIDWTSVQLDRSPTTRELIYRVSGDRGQVELGRDEVIHLKGPSNDGVVGLSVIQAAAQSVGHGLAMQAFSARFFQNSATPRVIFTVPKNSDKDAIDEFLKDFQDRTTNKNQHKAVTIKSDITAMPLSISARDSQLLEAMQWSVRDVANWFQIPPHLLGDSSRTAYNSLSQENQSYLNRCLSPHLVNWESELMMKLAPEGDTLIEFERRAVLDIDIVEQTAVFEKALGKWLTAEEIRRFMNLPPMEMPKPEPAPTEPDPKGDDDDEE